LFRFKEIYYTVLWKARPANGKALIIVIQSEDGVSS